MRRSAKEYFDCDGGCPFALPFDFGYGAARAAARFCCAAPCCFPPAFPPPFALDRDPDLGGDGPGGECDAALGEAALPLPPPRDTESTPPIRVRRSLPAAPSRVGEGPACCCCCCCCCARPLREAALAIFDGAGLAGGAEAGTGEVGKVAMGVRGPLGGGRGPKLGGGGGGT